MRQKVSKSFILLYSTDVDTFLPFITQLSSHFLFHRIQKLNRKLCVEGR